MLRFAAKGLAATILLCVFLAFIAALQARQAIQNGALAKPWRCVSARDFDAFRSGNVSQARMDGWIAERVRDFHLDDQRVQSGMWHARGMWAYFGVKVAYREDSRRDMALRLIRLSELCHRDLEQYRQMKAAR